MPYYYYETRAMNETTATGTDDVVISGSVPGYQSLVNTPLVALGRSFPYVMEGLDGACAGQVEVGYGTLDTGAFVRDVDAVSISAVDGTSAIGKTDFLAGTKRIYVAPIGIDMGFLSEFRQNFTRGQLSQNVAARLSTEDDTPTIMSGYATFGGPTANRPGDGDPAGETFNFLTSLNTSYTFDVIVNAVKPATNDCAAWRVTCLVNIDGGVPALVGTPTPTLIAATGGAGAWDLDVGVSSDALTLTATGAAASNIEWSAVGFATGFSGI